MTSEGIPQFDAPSLRVNHRDGLSRRHRQLLARVDQVRIRDLGLVRLPDLLPPRRVPVHLLRDLAQRIPGLHFVAEARLRRVRVAAVRVVVSHDRSTCYWLSLSGAGPRGLMAGPLTTLPKPSKREP